MGPGAWVEITGRASDFKLPIKTLDGTEIENLETWGVPTVISWHAIWVVMAALWLTWWVRRPLLIPRHAAINDGNARLLINRSDLAVGAVFIVATVALVAGGFLWAEETYPRTIPLQGGRAVVKPLPKTDAPVEFVVERATYDVPGRSMQIRASVTNGGARPIRFGEFATSGLRFVNRSVPEAVAGVAPNYPKELVPPAGMVLSDDAPLAPGETRTLQFDMTDSAWETERLTSLLNDPDNRVGGLLFCFDDQGKRIIANVSGSIVPIFKDLVADTTMNH
jgi:methane/ammonia monooxygenase subunit B